MGTNEKNINRQLALDFAIYTDRNIFLTGKAGTGKTTLLKEFLEKTDKNTAVIAPTGVAAINAGGMTIHSFFQLPSKTFLPNNDPIFSDNFINRTVLVGAQKIRKDRRRLFLELDTLIIDEISMVRADLLDTIDFTLRRLRKDQSPFGGLQVIVVGDLYQLAPVVREHEWQTLKKYYDSPFFFSSAAWSASGALTIELKKVYRQDDERFISILNNIRDGNRKKEDIDQLNDRFDHKQKHSEIITLTTHNRKANAINQTELRRLETKEIKLKATVKGQFNESSFPTQEQIILKPGAQVMYIRNNIEAGYFNGKIGTVVKEWEDTIEIRSLDDDSSIFVEPIEWKNTQYVLNKESSKIEPKDIGSFEQYPLRLAWAVTVHKSQGLTFDNVVVDLEDTFAPGQMYVALSRCRSLDGLTLSSMVREENIIIDNRIKSFYESIIIPDNIDEILSIAKVKYEERQLRTSFSLAKIIELIDVMEETATDKDIPEKINAIRLIKVLRNKALDMHEVAKKFDRQLLQLMALGNQVEELKAIFDRSNKGIMYFTDELHEKIITPLYAHKKKYKVKKNTRTYIQSIDELINQMWVYMKKLYTLTYQDKKIFTQDQKHNRTETFEAIANKPKPKVGETQKISLEMWNEGKKIEEIAKERGLVTSTIIGHMAKWVKEGKMNVGEIMSIERVEEVWQLMQDNPEKGSAEIRELAKFPLSYAEITLVKNWASFKGFQ